jgi:predicted dehydrogenase
MLNVCLIGFGGIAQAHRRAYEHLMQTGAPVCLKAACDIDPNRFTQKVKINLAAGEASPEATLSFYTDLDAMLAAEKPDLVDICLPTPLHADTAVEMLRRGYHVLSEKPMARTFDLCRQMLQAAKQAQGRLMIGQCLRFYPQYEYLKGLVDSQLYGRVIAAFFERLSGPPVWAWQNWYMDYVRAGGCLLDMHIHDLDMCRYLFGEPESVSCRTQDVQSRMDSVHTNLYYPDKPVTAIGDWSLDGVSFRHGYRVSFESATVIFDSQAVWVHPRAGEPFRVDLPYELGGIEREIDYFVRTIEQGAELTTNPPLSAALTVKLAETLRDSAQAGGERLAFEAVIA